MNILYLPLDERPCNYDFPQMHLAHCQEAQLTVLPRELLGKKKRGGDVDAIETWLNTQLTDCDAAVISLETLLFGGLLPSRLHHSTYEELSSRLLRFKQLIQRIAEEKPIPVYLFGMVMRTPAYSSSDEEPDYYADFGRQLFRRAFLEHKGDVEGLVPGEQEELQTLEKEIPRAIRDDYEIRRGINRKILSDASRLFADGLVRGFLLPQDDTARYGYGPRDKELLYKHFTDLGIQDRVLSYPGADEVGCVLCCRALMDLHPGMRAPAIWIEVRDAGEADQVPKYEGQPLIESCRDQISSAGAFLAESPKDADIILALNTSSRRDLEARNQVDRDASDFIGRLKELNSMAPLIIADTAYPNGGDTSFLREMDARGLLTGVLSYAGWNTNGNSLGTAVSAGIIEYCFPNSNRRQQNLLYRLYDDWAYQAVIRWQLDAELRGGLCTLDTNSVMESLPRRLEELLAQELPGVAELMYRIEEVGFPWARLFEIRVSIQERV